ncbi:MAG: MerR family transcriptional regulator [Clostridiales bacterium]|nr:MerR family transcriptional regulator [Clostridiales bacterium]
MLKIGNFSKLSRISIRMLRHYDELGLLKPITVDNFTGYRFYDESQLLDAARIQVLKSMGFSISEILLVIQKYTNSQELEHFFLTKRKEIQRQQEQLDEKLCLLSSTIEWLRKDGNIMNYAVNLKTLPERYVASVRKIIPGYEHEGILWGILMSETASLNMKDGDPCYASAIFHDSDFKEQDVDVEVQKTVLGKYTDTENVKFKTEPEVQIASTIFKGGYDQISMVNQTVAKWISGNGYEFDGLAFNIYHVSPHETKNSDEFVTEVCYAVKRK